MTCELYVYGFEIQNRKIPRGHIMIGRVTFSLAKDMVFVVRMRRDFTRKRGL